MKINKEDKFFIEKTKALKALSFVMDPELEVNIVDLGLVYEINFFDNKRIHVVMTFSTPGCPLGESIENGVKNTLAEEFPFYEIEVEIVFEPMWAVEMMSDSAKQQLGITE